jgi:glutamine synthetase type III
MENAAIDSIL